GLSCSPVGQVENGIIAACDPHLSTGAIPIRKIAPCVGSLVSAGCNRKEAPDLLSALSVVGTHETFFFLIASAATQSLDYFSVRDQRAAGIAVALPDFGIPNKLAVAGIKRFHAVAARKINLVLINRNATHGDVSAKVIFPNDFTCSPFDRLNDA